MAQHFVKALLNRAELLAINPTQLPRTGLLARFGLGHMYESRVYRQVTEAELHWGPAAREPFRRGPGGFLVLWAVIASYLTGLLERREHPELA